MEKRWLCLTIWAASFCPLQAQDTDSLFQVSNDSLLSFSDSLNIFNLIDSILNLEEEEPLSTLSFRLAYNSNVLSAGRTLGIDQFGLSPGVSFYHKSGFYGDLAGYWSQDFDPKFYLMILSGGYMHVFNSKFSINGGYDRYFTINNDFLQFKNTLSVTPYLDLKPIALAVNYSFYFGDGTAHRLLPSLNILLEKQNFLKLDKVSFIPSIYLLLGNQSWTEFEIIDPETPLERLQNYIKYGTPYKIVAIEKTVFGVMNYAYVFLLNVADGNWSFYLSYAYSIPKALPGEPLLLSETGFVAAGISYSLDFKKD